MPAAFQAPALLSRDLAPYMRRGWLVRRMLLAADLFGLTVAFVLAQLVAGAPGAADRIRPDTEFLVFLVTLPLWVVVAKLYGLYDRDEERADHSTADELIDVLHLVTVGAWLLFAGAWMTELADPNMEKLVVFWALSIVLVTSGRAAARSFCRRRVLYLQNTIIVGAGEIGQTIAEKLLRHPEYGINLVGFVDDFPKERSPEIEHVSVLGGPESLPDLIELLDIERVIVAFSNDSTEETLELIRSLKNHDVQVAIVPRLFELVGPSVGIHTVEGIPMIGLPAPRLARSSKLLKRVFDLTITVPALLLLSPWFALFALLIKRDSPGPVFFRQLRVGEDGVPFRIIKFRTMRQDAEEQKDLLTELNMHARNGGDPRMFKIADDPRITGIGKVLRRFSLDELPQLWNVLRGEMSLVGPRPLILPEARFVDAWGRSRLDLKPGITGLWQVLGRSDISFDEMIKLDYLYVTTWSIANDLKLLFKTMPIVTRGQGSY
jgi:exopolysaccharide biosynthesis polyprenyl glycosylphosphotransferase